MTSPHADVAAEPITDGEALELWEVVDKHAQRGGVCPVCRRARRCWPRAEAVSRLILTGRYREPRPASA